MSKFILLFSALSGATSVILGAFGAHGLKGRISEQLLSAFQTGVYYQFFHTIALFGLGILLLRLQAESMTLWYSAASTWIAGIILFSGSLYGLALGAPSWFGPITPIGGLLLIIGWLCLMAAIVKTSF